MKKGKNKQKTKNIFFDVDTQNDFMDRDGALYVPGAEEIRWNLANLTFYAGEKNILVLGSMDNHFGTKEYKHRESELQRWGGPFPDHCIDGTWGQWKIGETILNILHSDVWIDMYINNLAFYDIKPREHIPKYVLEQWKVIGVLEERLKEIETGNFNFGIGEILKEIKKIENGELSGIYFEKQSYDVFSNPVTEKVLEKARIKKAIVYGVATDYCVKAAVLGMQARGIQTYVVKDAIKGVSPETTKKALKEMTKAGAKFVKTSDVLEGKYV